MSGKDFNGYMQTNNHFTALANSGLNVDVLPAGVYTAGFNSMAGTIHFNAIKTNYDEIVDLPSDEYTQVMNDIKTFMKPETKELFDKFGFIYKRSALLQGPPGTGKTVIINRICEEVVKMGGIVLMSPKASLCPIFFKALTATQPDTMVLCVFEEFDQYFYNGECDDESILSLLDGETQRRNVMFLATTNFGDQISPRFKRPGRFSTVIDMQYPNTEARKTYLVNKIGEDVQLDKWVSSSNGLSIDELKETVLAVKCLGQPLEQVIKRVRNIRGEQQA